jgi:uncharacterized membrane protein
VKPLRILLTVGYPFAAFAALTYFPARGVALAVGIAMLLRAIAGRSLGREHLAHALRMLGPAIGVLLLAGIYDEGRFLLFAPALTNAALLIAFARTLRTGPSMVETFARWQGHQIADDRVGYCRTVTAVWCAFFFANGGVSLWLALYATLAQWTVYTGIVAYLLVGALFAVEIAYRAWRFRDYRDGLADLVLRRIFPPRDPAR